MGVYTIEAPDGRKLDIEASDEASAIKGAQEWVTANPKKKVSAGKDSAKSTVSGLIGGFAGIPDMLGGGPASSSALINMAGSVASAFGAKNVSAALHGTADAMSSPVTKLADKTIPLASYQPQTWQGKFAKTIATMAPNALIPGGAGRGLIPQAAARTAAVVAPGVISEGMGQGAEALGAGPKTAAAARFVGAVAGSGAAGLRGGVIPEAEKVANVGIIKRLGSDPAAMRAEQQSMRDAGVEPSLIDVTGERGRRIVRAVGVKSQDAGEVLQGNARTAVADAKPGVSDQTRKLLSDPRTADQFVSDLLDKRQANTTRDYAGPYETPVKLSDDVLKALSDAPGKSALQRARRAAVARQDDQRIKEIDSLLNADPPLDLSPEARMARANEQGFTQDAYHGTPQAFEGDVRVGDGSFTGDHAAEAIYSADKPVVANSYARGEQPAVYPLRLRPKGFAEVSDDVASHLMSPLVNEANGAPGVIVRNTRDYSHLPIEGETPRHDMYAAIDPSRVRSRFDRFEPEGYRPPPETVSAATLDRTQIALGRQSKRLKKNEGGDIASGLDMRRGVINSALDDVPELAPARKAYRQTTQAIEIIGQDGKRATRKDIFSTDPADYQRWVAALPDEGRAANAIAIRQEILDTLGGQRKSSMGSVEQLVDSQYARANLRAALGEQVADKFLGNIEARLRSLRNAQFVAPNSGSRTNVLENDVSALNGVIEAGKAVAHVKTGNVAALGGMLMNRLQTIGISEKAAKSLADMAVDPAQLDKVIAYLERTRGHVAAQKFLSYRQALLAGSAAMATTAAAPAPEQ